jgi:ferredoxin
MTPTVTIDRAKCQGTGYCVKIAPHLFELGESPPARATGCASNEVDAELLLEAEDACPTRAILVDE